MISPWCFLRSNQCAAADAQHVARETSRARRSEEGDRLRDVLGLTALAERREPATDLAHDHRHLRRHARLDEARRDRVDGDAARRELTGEEARQADDAGLRRAVVRLTHVA